MRHTTFLAGALLALSAPVAAQWSDNFEGYAANQQLQNVGGWFGWDNTPAAAATVDATRSRSFPNSLLVGGSTDAVHPQIGATSGRWTMTAWQYIPTGGLSGDLYFILNSEYSHGGPYTWTTQLKCEAGTQTVGDDLRPDTPQPIVFDQWAEFRLEIDLDANTVSNYYNGGLVSTGTYATSGPLAIENIDLFSTGGTCNWDDIALEWRGDAFETYAANTALDNVGGWFGWDNTPAAAASVDGTRARSTPNSLLVGATTDAVHPNIGITSGRWVMTAWQYIPTGGLAGDIYFILNNEYNHGGPYTWTTELRAVASTGMVVDDFRTNNPQPIVFDQWVEYRLEIDLDADTVSNYYNGGLVSQGVYATRGGPVAIENIDLFSTGGTCNWDDISLREAMSPPCYETDIGTALGMSDDSVVTTPLGFTFPFPGGSTTDIGICSNGFIWLDGTETSTDYSNSVAEFLGSSQAAPRIAAAWRDLNPAASASDDVYLRLFPDRAVVTWHQVVRYSGTDPMTVQCQLLADGSVYVFFNSDYDLTGGTASSGRTLVGIKAGTGNVADPGNTDYTASAPLATTVSTVYEFFADSVNFDMAGRGMRFVPNTLGGYDVSFRADCGASAAPYGVGCPAATPVTMATSAPPFLGSSFTFDVANVPGTTSAAALLIGMESANLSLDPFGWTGCSAYTQTLPFWAPMPFTPPTASLPFAVPSDPLLIGLAIYTQAAVIDGSNVYTSNGLRLEFGSN